MTSIQLRAQLRAPSQQAQALLYTTWWALEAHHARIRRAKATAQDGKDENDGKPDEIVNPVSHGGRVLIDVHRRTSVMNGDGEDVPAGTEAPYSWKLAAFFYRVLENVGQTWPHRLILNTLQRAELAAVRDDRGPQELQSFLAAVRERWPQLSLTPARRVALYEHFYIARIGMWFHMEREKHWRGGFVQLSRDVTTNGFRARLGLLTAIAEFAEAEAARTLATLAPANTNVSDHTNQQQAMGTWKASERPSKAVAQGVTRRYPRIDVQSSAYMLAPLWADPFSPIKHEALGWMWRDTRPSVDGRPPLASGPSGRVSLNAELAALLGCAMPPNDPGRNPVSTDELEEVIVSEHAVQHAFFSVLHQTLLMIELDARTRAIIRRFESDARSYMRGVMGDLTEDFRANLSAMQPSAPQYLNQCTYTMQYFVFVQLGKWATMHAEAPAEPKTVMRTLVASLVAPPSANHSTNGPMTSESDVNNESETAKCRAEFAYLAEHLGHLAEQCYLDLSKSLQRPTRRQNATNSQKFKTSPNSEQSPSYENTSTSPLSHVSGPNDTVADDAASEPEDLPPALTRTLSSYILVARRKQMLTDATKTPLTPVMQKTEGTNYPHVDESDDDTDTTATTTTTGEESAASSSSDNGTQKTYRRQMQLLRKASRQDIANRSVRAQAILAGNNWQSGTIQDDEFVDERSDGDDDDSDDNSNDDEEDSGVVGDLSLGVDSTDDVLRELGFFEDVEQSTTTTTSTTTNHSITSDPIPWGPVDRRRLDREDEEVLAAQEAALRARTYTGHRKRGPSPELNHQYQMGMFSATELPAPIVSPRRRTLFGKGRKARKILKRAASVSTRNSSTSSNESRSADNQRGNK